MYKTKKSADKAYAGYRATKHMNEEQDPQDIVSMDIPLFIRILELVREDIKDDASLHVLVQRIIEKSKEKQDIAMSIEDYESIIKDLNLEQNDHIIDENVKKLCSEISRLCKHKK